VKLVFRIAALAFLAARPTFAGETTLDAALAKAKAEEGVKIACVAEKATIDLGEEIVLHVALANASDTAMVVNELRLDELSVAFKTTQGDFPEFEYCELACLPGGDVLDLRKETLAPGKDLRATFRVPVTIAGKARFSARYFGFGDPEGEGYSAEPVVVEVKPDKSGATRLAAVLETDAGTVTIDLLPEVAPNTVLHFARLVRSGFYDGTVFHRIEPGFCVQGGDPRGTGLGGPDFALRGEFNDRKHVAGTVAMARTADPDSAGSQFYFTLGDQPSLDGQYTVFGQTASGYEAVTKMAADPKSRPVLKKATLAPRAAENAPTTQKKESGS
jgi:cyclophilin family peptidyl-prolyl cis-trans isomerase